MTYSFLFLILVLLSSNLFSLTIVQPELTRFSVSNAADIRLLGLRELGAASEIAWVPHENVMIVANQEGVWKFDVDDLDLQPTLIAKNVVDDLVISANGKIVAGRDNAFVHLWDINTNKQIAILAIEYSDRLWLNEDGSVLVLTYQSLDEDIWKDTLHFWDVGTNVELTAIEYDSPVSTFAVSPDESLLATGHANGSINLRNIDTGETIYTFEHYPSAIHELIFSPDATTIAFGGERRALGVWHLYEGEYVSIDRLSHLPDKLAFTSDGAILASSQVLEGGIYLRDGRDGSELAELTSHENDVIALAFNTDNTLLATSSLDGTLRLWGIRRQ